MKVITINLEEGKIYRCHKNNDLFEKRDNGFIYVKYKESDIWEVLNILPYSLSELELEEVEQEIDWSKVPRGIDVRVRNYEGNLWTERKFICKTENKSTPFVSYTNSKQFVEIWKYCEIVGEVKNEWLKEV